MRVLRTFIKGDVMKNDNADKEVVARVREYTDRLHELSVLKSCVEGAKKAVFYASPSERRFHIEDMDSLVALCVYPEYLGQPEEDWAVIYVYEEPAGQYPHLSTWEHYAARFGE